MAAFPASKLTFFPPPSHLAMSSARCVSHSLLFPLLLLLLLLILILFFSFAPVSRLRLSPQPPIPITNYLILFQRLLHFTLSSFNIHTRDKKKGISYMLLYEPNKISKTNREKKSKREYRAKRRTN